MNYFTSTFIIPTKQDKPKATSKNQNNNKRKKLIKAPPKSSKNKKAAPPFAPTPTHKSQRLNALNNKSKNKEHMVVEVEEEESKSTNDNEKRAGSSKFFSFLIFHFILAFSISF